MTDQPPDHLADPAGERLADPAELDRPAVEFSRLAWLWVAISVVLGLALLAGVFWWVITRLWAIP